MKKWMVLTTAFALILGLFTGCSLGSKQGDLSLYYMNGDNTGLSPMEYSFEKEGESDQEKVEEVLEALATPPNDTDYSRLIPAGVTVNSVILVPDSQEADLDFSAEYYEMDTITEALMRAGIVRTLIQLEGITAVRFSVAGEALTIDGNLISAMNGDTFMDYLGEDTDSLEETELVLYYSSADGQSLVAEKRDVYYSSNVPLERVIIENLLKSPDTEGALVPIPSNTKVLSVSTTDGICYLNLDSSFLNGSASVSEQVTIYSIVNSLTELDSIRQVQISINGEQGGNSFLDGSTLNEIYERNTDLIVSDTNTPDSVVTFTQE